MPDSLARATGLRTSRKRRSEFTFKNKALKTRTKWAQSTALERMGGERGKLGRNAGGLVNSFPPEGARNLGFSDPQGAAGERWGMSNGGGKETGIEPSPLGSRNVQQNIFGTLPSARGTGIKTEGVHLVLARITGVIRRQWPWARIPGPPF